jgi:RecA-family ATPase
MELKLNDSTIVKAEGNKAEIISDKTYRLTIFLDKNKVIATYASITLTIEFSKFDTEKIARKIFSIVRTTHKFSIIAIQKALMILSIALSIDELYAEILKKLKKAKENENIQILLKIYELLEKS